MKDKRTTLDRTLAAYVNSFYPERREAARDEIFGLKAQIDGPVTLAQLKAWASAPPETKPKSASIVLAAMLAGFPPLNLAEAAEALGTTYYSLKKRIDEGVISAYPGPSVRQFMFPCQILAEQRREEVEDYDAILEQKGGFDASELEELLIYEAGWKRGNGGWLYGYFTDPKDGSTTWATLRRLRFKFDWETRNLKLDLDVRGSRYRWRDEYPKAAGEYIELDWTVIKSGWLWFGKIPAIKIGARGLASPSPTGGDVEIPRAYVKHEAPAPAPAPAPHSPNYQERAVQALLDSGWVNTAPNIYLAPHKDPRWRIVIDGQDISLEAEWKPGRDPEAWEVMEVDKIHEVTLQDGKLKIGQDFMPEPN